MAQEVIFLGTIPGDGTGTNMRDAGGMINRNFDEVYSAIDYADDPTTIALTESYLDTNYPAAEVGFRVFALSIILGSLIYLKTTSGWVSIPTTIVM